MEQRSIFLLKTEKQVPKNLPSYVLSYPDKIKVILICLVISSQMYFYQIRGLYESLFFLYSFIHSFSINLFLSN